MRNNFEGLAEKRYILSISIATIISFRLIRKTKRTKHVKMECKVTSITLSHTNDA